MSRIGKKPVAIPAGVKVEIAGAAVKVEGPKGKLAFQVHPRIQVAQKDGKEVVCSRAGDTGEDRALHGMVRAILQNMMIGVTSGFEKRLEIIGVGFNAQLSGKTLSLTVGFSHPVKLPVPEGVTVALPDATHIVVSGPDKQKVGQFAAHIREARKPEPYKGTGIRYQGEYVRRKAGKAFGSSS